MQKLFLIILTIIIYSSNCYSEDFSTYAVRTKKTALENCRIYYKNIGNQILELPFEDYKVACECSTQLVTYASFIHINNFWSGKKSFDNFVTKEKHETCNEIEKTFYSDLQTSLTPKGIQTNLTSDIESLFTSDRFPANEIITVFEMEKPALCVSKSIVGASNSKMLTICLLQEINENYQKINALEHKREDLRDQWELPLEDTRLKSD